MEPIDVLHFWFVQLKESQWFEKDPEIDREIFERFGDLHARAVKGELAGWRDSAKGRLAEIIVLDQFSRNLYRDTPEAFAQDAQALTLAQELVHLKMDQDLNASEKAFAYMPYMHSESAEIHEEAVRLFSSVKELSFNLEFELKHKTIIETFGRYPHRNKILGRVSTPSEVEFLKLPNSSF